VRRCSWVLLALASCTTEVQRPDPSSAADEGVGLSALGFASLEIPDDNRPDHAEPPEAIPLTGWRFLRATKDGAIYRTRLPIRSRALFFNKPAGDMHLRDEAGEVIPHVRDRRGQKHSWTWNGTHLDLVWPEGTPEGVTLHYSRATERERALNFGFSGLEDPEEFVRTKVQIGTTSRSGLLLPAPATAAWELEVPEAAELHLHPVLVAPETLDAEPSDGAELSIAVMTEDTRIEVASVPVEVGDGTPLTVDLSRWSGQSITLQIQTLPGKTARFDYVFLGEPAVVPRREVPRRVVLVFVDTLRPDHLSLYGYERETSPALEALAQDATVFTSARSIAPWTLPSARAAITGRQPEWYGLAPTLAERFSAAGYATAMWAGNVYLSSNFEMTEDWGLHHVENWPGAELQLDRALAWLDAQDGRDALLLLHLMDPHLPYVEPEPYASRWAGTPPKEFEGEFHLNAVRRATITPAHKQYIRDRYDQNIRYTDDQLARLYGRLGPDDILVFFSDHGEEMWEHGGFEHGHTLYDELLRVPLIIKGPGMPAARVTEPTSLLDIAPTVLSLAGLDPEGSFDGLDLGPAARDESGARQGLAQRDLAFGRPLYGSTQWGVLHGSEKYSSQDGRERLFDLAADPGEDDNLLPQGQVLDTAVHHERLGAALGSYAGPAYRLEIPSVAKREYEDVVFTVDVPGGVRDAFGKDDVAGFAKLTVATETIAESGAGLSCESCSDRIDRVTVTVHGGYRGGTEAFVFPEAPMALVTPRLVLEGTSRGETTRIAVKETAMRTPRNSPASIARLRAGRRMMKLGFGIVPAPPEGSRALEGHDEELDAMLQAMGYAVGDGAEEHQPEDEPSP
jgi:arylsulfatase A-like enzyme